MKYNKRKNVSRIIFIIFLSLFILGMLSNCIVTNAEDINNIYNAPDDATKITSRAGKILWIVMAIGISAGVIMIAVIGVRYIVSSPEGKADLKNQMIVYCIGAFILMSGGTLAGIIAKAAKTLNG